MWLIALLFIPDASVASSASRFSGLEASDVSNSSFIVPVAEPLMFVLNEQLSPGEKSTSTSMYDEETKENNPNYLNCIPNPPAKVGTTCNSTIVRVLTPAKVRVSTPAKPYKNPVNALFSPDLFSDEETEVKAPPRNSAISKHRTCEERYIVRNDRKLLRRVQDSLHGVFPPPSITNMQITPDQMLLKIKDNEQLFLTEEDAKKARESSSKVDAEDSNSYSSAIVRKYEEVKSLLVNCRKEECISEGWSNVLNLRYYGLQ